MTTHRTTLNLDETDMAALSVFVEDETPERQAVEGLMQHYRLTGRRIDGRVSEAALLRTLVRYGAERLAEEARAERLAAGYDALADMWDNDVIVAEREARTARRAERNRRREREDAHA